MTLRPPAHLSVHNHREQCSDDELFVLYGFGDHTCPLRAALGRRLHSSLYNIITEVELLVQKIYEKPKRCSLRVDVIYSEVI